MAVLAALTWSIVTVGGAAGAIARAQPYVDWLIPAGPIVSGLVVLLARPHSTTWMKLVFGWTLTLAAALLSLIYIGEDWLYTALPTLIAVTALAARRWPTGTVIAVFLISGTFGSVEAFSPVPTGPLTDLLLAGAWVALLWGWTSGRIPQPGWLPFPFLLLIAYIAATAAAGLLAGSLEPALFSFRASAWLMAGALLVSFFIREPRQHALLHKAALIIGALVGGYAMFRWAVGPAGREEELVRRGGPYVLGENDAVRLFGSFPSPQTLGFWASCMLPFAFASALAPVGGRWRLLALAVTGMCGAALAGADTRFAMVAAAAGGLVVLALFAVGRGFDGRRALPLALGVTVLAVGGGTFAAARLADDGSEGARFRGLLNPLQDKSVQDRLVKWKTVLDDIDRHPFGHGLGSSGAAEKKYARFSSAATFDPDSSYVKVAYDQGMMIMLLFVAGLIALMLGLAQRAARAPDTLSATLAVGACGTLCAFAVAISAGAYFEGLAAATPWLIVGLAMAPYVRDAGLRGTARR